MSRRSTPPVSYGEDVALMTKPVPAAGPSGRTANEPPAPSPSEARPVRRPILERSEPTIIYLHPDGKHQLRSYAVAQGLKVKVHDLLLEAVEEWASKRGLKGPFRTPSERQRRS